MKDKNSRSIQAVINSLNELAPIGTAEEWDNVGLLLGDSSITAKKAVVAIDLSLEVVKLAVKKKAELIINHHPCIFPKSRGLSKILSNTAVYESIRNGIAVASYHTNFDKCALEVITKVSKGLGIRPFGRLLDRSSSQLIKLVVFIPASHLEKVRTAVSQAGAGQIGYYDSCTFGTMGEGTFRGGESTSPFLGKPGQLEKAEEFRLETIFPKGLESKVLKALFRAHPYEEVAYDLYSLEQPAQTAGLVSGLGYGFWGEFPSPKPFSDVAKNVKSLFNIDGFWITEPIPTHVKKVGFVAGKGASFVESAVHLGCDLLITGEAGYHTAMSAARNGTAVMELGHRQSERFFISTMKEWLMRLGLEVEEVETSVQKIWQGGSK